MIKDKNLGIILIWLPFVLALLIVLAHAFLFKNRFAYSFFLNFASFNKVLEFPEVWFPTKGASLHKFALFRKWNPFVGEKEVLLAREFDSKKPKLRLHLSAILHVDYNETCLINGRIYHSGDMIDYIKIVKIFPSSVIFELPTGKKVVLNVGEEIFL